MIVARTSSPDATRELAAALAALLGPGDLLLLAGDLGAGKTAFVQGVAKALGIDEPVTSPTFTLHRQYVGRLELNHLDVYRFTHVDEVLDVGLGELLDAPAVTCIEWGDKIVGTVPADFLEVRITLGEGDDDRVVEIRPIGSRWSARSRALGEALGPWVDGGTAPGASEGASTC
ncbi:MAG: tRNA (adenosine(37)-N6)-threonylcarbamoyltransferase complex ATPase subunit type 1 TsaE [Actinomycetota bacterium]|nr:tRNA (adenosine(37)-N6)-threonylcarbamoyltransferase complex ATPase subunit type 1 TsaE [Actinomycetota bacterium]